MTEEVAPVNERGQPVAIWPARWAFQPLLIGNVVKDVFYSLGGSRLFKGRLDRRIVFLWCFHFDITLFISRTSLEFLKLHSYPAIGFYVKRPLIGMGVSRAEQWPDMREGKEECVMFGLYWCIRKRWCL